MLAVRLQDKGISQRERSLHSVSSIICGYNQGRFAREAIASVINQTSPPAQIIFVDNGSTDDTPAVVQKFFPRVRYLRQANLGPSAARNRGLHESTTDFVHFMDADDWIEPDMYAEATTALSEGSLGDVCVGGEKVLAPDGSLSVGVDAPTEIADPTRFLFSHHPWCVHAAIVRRTTAQEIGGFDDRLWRCEDWDFWLRLACADAKFGRMPGRHAVYRRVPQSNSTNYAAVFRATSQVLRQNLNASRSLKSAYSSVVSQCIRQSGEWTWHGGVEPQLNAHLSQRQWFAASKLLFAVGAADRTNIRRMCSYFRRKLALRRKK